MYSTGSLAGSGRATTVVVNADDFGLSAGVNQGIEACFQHGILRSASLMPNGDAFEDAVDIARQTPGLGVGVHISLVAEKCVAPRQELGALVDEQGNLPASYAAFAKGYMTRRFTLQEIRREVEAQMQRALQTGLALTHVDSHQHVHLLPGVFEVVLQTTRQARIGVIRTPVERRAWRKRLTVRGLQLNALTGLAARAASRAQAEGVRVVDAFWGLDASGALNEAALLDILGRLSPGVNEIMAHPGFSDAVLHQKYQWGYRWDDEAAALQSAAIRQCAEEKGFRLAHFGEI